jgi:RNA polymerase subunit RPABC4/transcription elongation factor Spt4
MFLAAPGADLDWEGIFVTALVIFSVSMVLLWLGLAIWTYRDIRRRTSNPAVQAGAVLAVLALFVPGYWAYLLLRPRETLREAYEHALAQAALLQDIQDRTACPSCRKAVLRDYLVCPACRTRLQEACRGCSRPLRYEWLACPYCALDKRIPAVVASSRPAVDVAAPSVAVPEPIGEGPAPIPVATVPSARRAG